MQKVFQIAYVSIRKLLAKKTLYIMLLVLILIIGLMGSQLFSMSAESGSMAQKADVLAQMMGIWADFSVYFVIVYSAAAIYNDLKSKSIVGVIARPITRRKFLLGRWAGVTSFFAAFILVGAFMVSLFMVIWDIPFTPLLFIGILHNIGVLFAYSAIAFVLSLFIPAVLGGGITFILFILRNLFGGLTESSSSFAEYLGYVLYYLLPANSNDDMVRNGILDNLLNPEYGYYLSIITENFAYAGLLFFAGTLLYQKKDIILD
jgi:ABC-type transport system involved in multi-copper enzyme maturation permease subunit